MKNNIEIALRSLGLLQGSQAIVQLQPVYGGSINDSFHIRIDSKDYFLKCNRRADIENFFTAEINGLKLLRESKTMDIPQLVGSYFNKDFGLLVLEFIKDGSANQNSWELFGRSLAELHLNTNDYYGLESQNFIGSLIQVNDQKSDWIKFFIENRLEAQYQLAREKSILGPEFRELFDQLYTRLEELIPNESPALLHGDLWSGNYKFDEEGQPYIFDPAVYYGHREVDIAMMQLFGGFDQKLLESYNEIYPLQAGWENRIALFNLYPLLVHVNLFGGSYISSLKQGILRYI